MASDKKPVALRMSPDIKAAAERRAKEENRSFASYLEWLVLVDIKRHTSEEPARDLIGVARDA